MTYEETPKEAKLHEGSASSVRNTEGGETARRQCFFCASSCESFQGFHVTRPKRGTGYGCSPTSTRVICMFLGLVT